jgi:hypothetical protein
VTRRARLAATLRRLDAYPRVLEGRARRDVDLAGRWCLRAKGAPSDLTVYALQAPGA